MKSNGAIPIYRQELNKRRWRKHLSVPDRIRLPFTVVCDTQNTQSPM